MKTAVIYCRVSTARQAEEELPLQSQLARCREKAAALDAEVIRVFQDQGISARSDQRPAFQAAVLYCESLNIDFFLTWSTSRFARNRADAILYKARLKRAGTQIVYAGMDIRGDTDSGWVAEAVLELFDELSSRLTAADTRRSMVRAAQAGYWTGGRPPYGYEAQPAAEDPRRRRLHPIPGETAIVQRIFSLRLEGHGAKQIAAILRADGLSNRGHQWAKSAVLGLLRNEAVIGQRVFGKRPRNGLERRRTPPGTWLIVDSHAPIIDRATWDLVQSTLTAAEPAEDTGSPHSMHAFTGLLYCGLCGASMQIETAKGRNRRYSYYNCRNSQQHGSCECRRIRADQLDTYLIEEISDHVFTAETLEELASELQVAAGHWETDHRNRRQAVIRKMQDMEIRQSKLYGILELHGKDAPNLGDLTQRLRANNEEMRGLEDTLRQIDDEPPPVIEKVALADLRDLLLQCIEEDTKRTRAFFAGFIRKIIVESDHIRIEYDPNKLILNQSGRVPNKADWLPGPSLLGIKMLLCALPRIRHATARRRRA